MNPAQNQIYAKIGDDHAQDGEDAVNMEKQWLLEHFPKFFVQRGGLNQ